MDRHAAYRALFVLFMPAVIAEFLTGSTPIPSLLSPLTLPTLLGLYGCGALIVRELVVMWRKGWPSVLALGAAYGVIEEALDVKSWFNPAWPALGPLATYGRFAGVNWVWALELTVFHSVFSITIPLVLAALLFPDDRDKRWLEGRRFPLVGVLFAATVAFGFVFFPYSPPLAPYALALALAVGLVIMAHSLPASLSLARDVSPLGTKRVFAIGLGGAIAFFVLFWGLPVWGLPPVLDALLAAGLCGLLGRFLLRNRLSPLQQLSLASGALSLLVLVAVLGLDVLAGPPLVAIVVVAILFGVRKSVVASPFAQPVPTPAQRD